MKGKPGNTVNQDMIFVSPIEFIVLFIGLIGCSVDTKFAILIRFGLIFRIKLNLERKDLGLFWEVFAEMGVESNPIKEVSMMPREVRVSTCRCIIRERASCPKCLRKRPKDQ